MRIRFVTAAIMALLVLGGPAAASPEPDDVLCTVRDLGLMTGTALEEPVITGTYRQTAGERATWETATFFDDRYWSRAGGEDIVIELANPRAGDVLNVYKNKKVIHREEVSACDPFVTVPLETVEGDYARTFRYQSGSAIGPAVSRTFAVDTTAPIIAGETRIDAGTTDVTFSEPILEGSDSAQDWFVRFELEADPTGYAMQVDAVTPLDRRTRRLTFSLPEGLTYRGAAYAVQDPQSQRYRDAAGNTMVDTLG